MDQFQQNQTSKLPSEVYNTFVEEIESNKDVIIEHFISRGNVMDIPGFWDKIRNKLYEKGFRDNHCYTDIATLIGIRIETKSLVVTFQHEAPLEVSPALYSTFELIVK